MVKTNDLKKGTRIKLANGWYGTLADSKKGNVRMAEVEGVTNELGSIYAYDIVQARVNEEWMAVEHTPEQTKSRKLSGDVFGFQYTDQTEKGI